MQDYVTFLNDLAKNSSVDLEKVEKWWVSQVQQFFSASPLKLKIDSSSSLRTCLRSVFLEAEKRQAQSPGASVVGAVMQHLVGAKLEVLDIEQFFVANIFEWTRFDAKDRKTTLQDLMNCYNVIVESCETDPSLKIELA